MPTSVQAAPARRRRSDAFAACALLLAGALAGSCRSPQPASCLHYEASAAKDWQVDHAAELTTAACGATVRVSLHPTEPRLIVRIDNPAASRLDVRVGPEATRSSTAAIGEVQHRQRDGARGEGTTDFLPYLSMQPIEVGPGQAADLYLDNPLGREPGIGHYFVLVVELQTPKGARERRLLPLVVTGARPPRRP